MRPRLRARRPAADVRDLGDSSGEHALAARRRAARRASRRAIGSARSHVGSPRVAARDRRRDAAPAGMRGTFARGKDISMNSTTGLVVPAGGGRHLDMGAPGRFAALKLLGHETNGSIMLFEEIM